MEKDSLLRVSIVGLCNFPLDTYFGVSLHPDPPCGKWVEDYLNYARRFIADGGTCNSMGHC